MDRNLDPRLKTRQSVAARWIWGDEYSKQHGGQVDFYEGLSSARKSLVNEFLAELDSCAAATPGGRTAP